MSILAILNEIAATSSKLAKEAIVEREKNNSLLLKVFAATYDPTVNYWIKQIPEFTSTNSMSLEHALSNVLPDISSRKFTGDAARKVLTEMLCLLSKDDAEIMCRIIERDLKCGMSEGTINKVHKNLIPEYPYMRCSLLSKVKTDKWNWKNGVFVQTKMDALFCNITLTKNKEVSFQSRQGKVFSNSAFNDIESYVIANCASDHQYHGELMVSDSNGNLLPREIGNGILNSISSGGMLSPEYHLLFVVWDAVPLDEINGRTISGEDYNVRFSNLTILPESECFRVVESCIVHSLSESFAVYERALAAGQEGVILKERNMKWKDGTSKSCVKLKLEVDVDLEIVGFTVGNGKHASTFGAVECKSSDGKLVVNVSGFTDAARADMHKNRESLIGTIMTVRANEIMKGNIASLFLPRFVELREDKKCADSYQSILDQFESAKLGK